MIHNLSSGYQEREGRKVLPAKEQKTGFNFQL